MILVLITIVCFHSFFTNNILLQVDAKGGPENTNQPYDSEVFCDVYLTVYEASCIKVLSLFKKTNLMMFR